MTHYFSALVKKPIKFFLSRKIFLDSSFACIFNYHDISFEDSPQYSPAYSTRPDVFERQLDFLMQHFQFVSLENLLNPKELVPDGKPLACITFDDGFYSVKEYAIPMLAARNIPCTIFLCRDAILNNFLSYLGEYKISIQPNAKQIYLNERDICMLKKADVLFGSHTTDHGNLAEMESTEEAIYFNKAYLEKLLGYAVKHFAVPYGKARHWNERAAQYIFESGHSFIYLAEAGLVSLKPKTDSGIFPRLGVLNESPRELAFRLNYLKFRRLISAPVLSISIPGNG